MGVIRGRRMAQRKRTGSRLVVLAARSDALVLARPRLVELSPEQESEAVRLLSDLFARAARRRAMGKQREAA